MKKILVLPIILIITLMLFSCSNNNYDIVTTLFPQYDITRTIVGDKDLTYTLLLSPGVEAHDFEPTSKQVVQINQSKLFIYTSDDMEVWASNVKNKNSDSVFLNLKIAFEKDHVTAHNFNTESESHDHDHDNLHYWVNLHHTIHMINAIKEQIILLDQANEAYYESNALAMIDQVKTISLLFNTFESIEPKPLYYIGHNVFSLLNEEKSLNILSLTDSFSPDADPTSTQIQQMLNEIMTSNTTVVYFDPLETLNLANTIKADLNSKGYQITLLPLYSMHNISKKQYESNETLITLWQANYDNILTGYNLGDVQ